MNKVDIKQEVFDHYQKINMRKNGVQVNHRYVSFKLTDKMDAMVLDKAAPPETTFDEFRDYLPPNDSRWILYDVEWQHADKDVGSEVTKNKLVFISWCPDNAPIRVKMVHASSTENVKTKLNLGNSYQANDLEEISYASIQGKAAESK